MKILQSKITIGEWTFDFVSSVEITSSWDRLTDMCTIEMPRNIVFKRDNRIVENIIQGDNPVFNRGDNVVVKLGYDRNLQTVFLGRLSDVNPQRPMILMCEDDMYDLKQNSFVDETVTVGYDKDASGKVIPGTLKDLITKLFTFGAADFIFDPIVADIEIGQYKVKDTTIAKVLENLRSKLGIVSYFRITGDESTTFVSGLPYSTEDNFLIGRSVDSDGVTNFTDADPTINAQRTTLFKFGQNIITDKGLTYKRVDDQRVLVIGKSKQPNNTLIESKAGDIGGDIVTINYPGLSQAQLDQFVQDRLTKTKYEGFEGSFEAFLEPKVSHGETVEMINNDIPEKDGVYLIKDVVTTFGTNGARQKITLDNKISA